MRKFKVTVAVLLTLALLIGGAYIPKLVALLGDWHNTGSASLNPMASVELNIYQDISSIGKLAMMGRIDRVIPISESMSKMTREEVMDAVYNGLTPYMDAQLVIYNENYVEMRPYLTQVPDMPELHRVVWIITVSGDDSDFTFFDLVIDDETGNILRISYTVEKPRDTIIGAAALNIFADIFFSGLGIEDYREFAADDLEYAYVGDHADAIRYSFRDVLYGEVNVDLYVHENGFYIEFPSV